ncbi:hypothetical protein BKA04_000796 [Cryobacterium mesophilum]|uniref:Glycosyltransferase n=1 Tax=Terrimesophilobacter mesophilus TaxID=433647 RepID=A0A4R8V961_9MICO|nr:hypothetical protein [Terrimesophilobacter mesophilus]MBB5632573.1 hypothetical protein [Terrimesophilobacter mesophilus]TFB79389.1 hypothetical protein E3N84_04580 [Terrimesophilobacter mesophilus]
MLTSRTRLSAIALAGALILSGGLLTACSPSGPGSGPAPIMQDHSAMHMESPASQSAQSALYGEMRELWADHMQWTYATVKDFFHNQEALPDTLNRLLQNQVFLGDAIGTYYGDDAGHALTKLLTEHIQLAVPVLTAAKAGDDAGLKAGLDDWYANAQAIADFLTAANPQSWPAGTTSEMMKAHIDTTVAYSVDLLTGDYKKSIADYDIAFHHMMDMADALSAGIVAQFPDRF